MVPREAKTPVKQVTADSAILGSVEQANFHQHVEVKPHSGLTIGLPVLLVAAFIGLLIYVFSFWQSPSFWDLEKHARLEDAVNHARSLTSKFYDRTNAEVSSSLKQEINDSIKTLTAILEDGELSEAAELHCCQSIATSVAMYLEASLPFDEQGEPLQLDKKREELSQKVTLCKGAVEHARSIFKGTNGLIRPDLILLAQESDDYEGRIDDYLSYAYCIALASSSELNIITREEARAAIEAEQSEFEFWKETPSSKVPLLNAVFAETKENQ